MEVIPLGSESFPWIFNESWSLTCEKKQILQVEDMAQFSYLVCYYSADYNKQAGRQVEFFHLCILHEKIRAGWNVRKKRDY